MAEKPETLHRPAPKGPKPGSFILHATKTVVRNPSRINLGKAEGLTELLLLLPLFCPFLLAQGLYN